MVQVIVLVADPATTDPHDPAPPLVILADCEARPVAGIVATKTTVFAGSGPPLTRLKVKATWFPAATGLGDGLVDGTAKEKTLLGLSFATNASAALPFRIP